MSYVRTKEIREKQSKKMKIVTKNYNWSEIDRKRKETIKKTGVKVGRKKGEGAKKTGTNRNCVICNQQYWCIPSTPNRRVCSRKCLMQDKEYLNKLKNIDRSYQKTGNWASWLIKEETPEYTRYKNKVHKLTEKNYVNYIDLINPNRYPRTLCGVDGGWQLDHIKPIKQCFDENVSIEQAANISNLRMLPWKDNLMRNYGNNISKSKI